MATPSSALHSAPVAVPPVIYHATIDPRLPPPSVPSPTITIPRPPSPSLASADTHTDMHPPPPPPPLPVSTAKVISPRLPASAPACGYSLTHPSATASDNGHFSVFICTDTLRLFAPTPICQRLRPPSSPAPHHARQRRRPPFHVLTTNRLRCLPLSASTATYPLATVITATRPSAAHAPVTTRIPSHSHRQASEDDDNDTPSSLASFPPQPPDDNHHLLAFVAHFTHFNVI